MEETITGLRLTNDLLHSQIQSYGSKLDKLEESRINQMMGSTAPLESGATTVAVEEVIELRQNMSDLREAMRHLKRERDTIELKLSAAKSEGSRAQGALQTTQKLLDETRAELKKELEQRNTVRDDGSYATLMTEVTQLNIVRESNAHLRSENEQLFKNIADLTSSIAQAQSEVQPLQEKVRSLEAEKAALEAEV